MADQRSYIDSTNQAIFKVIQVVLQAIFLTQTHNYVAYLLIQILVTFSSNLVIYFKTNKIYPFLKNNNYPEIDKNTTLKMKKNVVGAISSKIGVVVMYGTDNLLVSKFIGLTMVGIYSNYMLVLNSVVSLLNQLFSPVASSIANYLNDDGEKDASNVFFRYMYIVNALSLLVGFGLTMVINMFIQIWLGKEYLLSNIVLSMLLLNWMINSMRSAVLTFMTALGTYWETRWKSLVESAVNLIVGLVLITQTHLGVLSVVLGSFAANVLVNMWFEPLVLFRKKPSISVAMYIRRYILYVILALLIAVIPLVFNDIKVQATFLNFITVGILSVVGFVFVFGAITFLFPENKYFRNLIRNIVKAKFGKK
ncbi:hypothetical protein HAU47_07800 [Weissella confusa]|nr:hypothetical protein [Weissella confusa]MBJ7620280.1 hypothetical protein [Weissella confusa]MBJ7667813.1 hypothetical protein [Weissella confusa]MBJ7683080.1 hypothetical protein [Weissella confusa]MBJ7685267.1 hypothetical protein [Weissella confusa]MBJ7702557.1 hypothetical protein [Weissella confusa]